MDMRVADASSSPIETTPLPQMPSEGSHTPMVVPKRLVKRKVYAPVPTLKGPKPVPLPPTRSPSTTIAKISEETHHWHFGVCASTLKGGDHLVEWIEFHRLAGVDHLFVFDFNDYTVPNNPEIFLTKKFLKKYQGLGVVTVIPESMPEVPENETAGCQMYGVGTNPRTGWIPPSVKECWFVKACHRRVAGYVDWLLPMDTSQFVYPRQDCSLSQYIKNACNEHLAYITVPWEQFGASGNVEAREGLRIESQIESGGDCMEHRYPKGCVQGEACGMCRQHRIIYNVKHCVKRGHIGALSHPVNTTSWKRAERHRRKEEAKPHGAFKHIAHGKHANWKSESCRNGLLRYPSLTQRECHDCCDAGIALNRYGLKSTSDFEAKLRANVQRIKRSGQSAEYLDEDDEHFADAKAFKKNDLSGSIGLSILRYAQPLRRLRATHTAQGTNSDVHYLTTPLGICYLEVGVAYTPQHGTVTTEIELPKTDGKGTTAYPSAAVSCCERCHKAGPTVCQIWSLEVSTQKCVLLSGSNHVDEGGEARLWRNFTVPATRERTASTEAVSGMPFHQGECSL